MSGIPAIADGADIIVNGYAFTMQQRCICVLNLNCPESACVLSLSGEILEACMDTSEISVVQGYFMRNRKFITAK